MWIAIEGNIGSGKSSLLDSLKDHIITIKEPIDKWGPYLEKFYKDPKLNGFMLQCRIMLSFLEIENEMNCSKGIDLVITERSVYSAHNIFNKLSKNEGNVSDLEYALLDEMNVETKTPDFYIYLRCTPDKCKERLLKRNEPNDISMEYLQKVHQMHEDVFFENNKDKTFVVDANESEDHVHHNVETLVRMLLQYSIKDNHSSSSS